MSEIDWELLDRYLSGEASAEECERLEAWLAEDPERWAHLAALRKALTDEALGESAVERAKAEVWTRLEQEIRTASPQSSKGAGRRPSRAPAREFGLPPRRKWFTEARLAAALFILVIGGGALGLLLLRWHQPAAPSVRVATTTAGQRASFRLPDGTQVVLGVASTLRYPGNFGRDSREVALEGEAYFQVTHDGRRPFVVRARDLEAKDLGTEFTVRAYPEDAGARVVVREGRVAIRPSAFAGRSERVVTPGELGRLGKGGEPTVEAADTAVWFAWTEGRLIFDGTPLREALPQLSRWFDLDFRLANSALGAVPLSATLRTQPTTDVLNNLAASLGMRQRRHGRTVTLYADPGR